MQWKTVTSTSADVGFVTIKNDSGSTLSAGQVILWDMAGNEDGLRVIDPNGTGAALVLGTAHTALEQGSTGLGQVYGPDDDVIVCRGGSASNDPLAIGDILDIVSASSCLSHAINGQAVLKTASDAAAGCVPPMFVAAESVAAGGASSGSTTTAKVFLRCL